MDLPTTLNEIKQIIGDLYLRNLLLEKQLAGLVKPPKQEPTPITRQDTA